MNNLYSFSEGIDKFVAFFGKLGAWCLMALMFVIIFDVTLRHWFVIGSTKLQELEWHLHGAIFLLAMGWAFSKDRHVRIELLSERLSLRTQAWFELMGIILFLIPYVVALTIFSWDYATISFNYNEASASPTGLPARYIIKYIIVFGVFLLGLAALSRLFKAVIFLFGPTGLAKRTPFAMKHEHEGAS